MAVPIRWLQLVLLVAPLGVLGNGLAAASQERTAAEILAPKDGANVSGPEDLRGRLTTKDAGWPIVLVRPVVGREPWYVQPEVNEVTEEGLFATTLYIGDDKTPPGTKFRVMVVVAPSREEAQARFKRGSTIRALPAELPTSEAVTVVRDGEAPREFPPESKLRSIKFAKRSWDVKRGSRLGPGPNDFSDAEENVSVDDNGQLRLAITGRDCAEVVGPSLGYGEYRWVVSGNLATLDPRVVLGLFVYRAPDRERKVAEVDFELARWGDRDKDNCQFVVQPYSDDSMHRFDSGKAGVLTVSFSWEEGIVRGRCWVGEDTSKKPLAQWEYTGPKVPKAGGERVRANLWLLDGQPPAAKERQEVVIRSFHFEPATQRKVGETPKPKPGAVAEILEPKDGAKVSASEGLKGRLTTKDAGWPVILVRPQVRDEPWYVQPEVTEVTADGLFTSSLYIGDDKTPPGTKFRILILIAPSREEANRRFKVGGTMDRLPPELPASSYITVIRE